MDPKSEQGNVGGSVYNTGDAAGGGGGGDTAGGGDLSFIPEEFRSHEAFSGITDQKALMEKFVSLHGAVGSTFKAPGEDATPEQIALFRETIGVPKDAKGYELKAPETLPNGMVYNEEQAEWFGAAAHRHGIPKAAAEALFNEFNQKASEQFVADTEALRERGKEVLSKLQSELGNALPDRFRKMRAMIANYDKTGEIDKLLSDDTLPYGSDERILRLLLNISQDVMSEDTVRGEGDSMSAKTPDEIQKEIDSIIGDNKSPYWDSAHPGNAEAVKKVEKLYSLLNKAVSNV